MFFCFFPWLSCLSHPNPAPEGGAASPTRLLSRGPATGSPACKGYGVLSGAPVRTQGPAGCTAGGNNMVKWAASSLSTWETEAEGVP